MPNVTMKEWRDDYYGKGYVIVRIIDDNNVIIKASAKQASDETPMTVLDRNVFYKQQAENGDTTFLRKGHLPDDWDQHAEERQGNDPRRRDSLGYLDKYAKKIFSKRAADADKE